MGDDQFARYWPGWDGLSPKEQRDARHEVGEAWKAVDEEFRRQGHYGTLVDRGLFRDEFVLAFRESRGGLRWFLDQATDGRWKPDAS